ncbi:MAG: hypothetical protein ACYSU7_12905 [Planctomycetota bacterium]
MKTFALALGGLLCVAATGCGQPPPEDLRSRVERGMDRAARYLISQQSADGTWRSRTYGALADGADLTPPVLKTLLLGPQSRDSSAVCGRARDYLRGWVAEDGSIPPESELDYPVYTAALAAIILNWMVIDPSGSIDEASRQARDAWIDYLRSFQLNERLGWQPDDASFGGWGYSVRPPRKPETDRLPFESDLSSTLFAVGALRLAGAMPDDPAILDALIYVKRCQNFSDDKDQGDPAFDDGGFFFTPANAAQNKAGIAGTDRHGAVRYHSYGTATADGFRALIRCGLPAGDARVLAAKAWLERNFTTETNPGVFEPALAADREAFLHYWCWSISHAFRLLGVPTIEQDGRQVPWAALIAEELLGRQHPDGSWQNPYSFMKEDDPLIATTLAVGALANCHQVMWPVD